MPFSLTRDSSARMYSPLFISKSMRSSAVIQSSDLKRSQEISRTSVMTLSLTSMRTVSSASVRKLHQAISSLVRSHLRVKQSLPQRKDSSVLFSVKRQEKSAITHLRFLTVRQALSLMSRYSQEKTVMSFQQALICALSAISLRSVR